MENEDMGELIYMYSPGSFTRWSPDNVDHNKRTLDGKGTLHAMRIVCSTTSMHRPVGYSKMCPSQRQKIKKLTNLPKTKGIAVTTHILSITLLDLNTKFIEAFSIWHFSIRLYFGSPKSSNLTREFSESLSIFSSIFFKPFMRSALNIV